MLTVSVRGVELAYWERGSGQAVLCVHETGTSAAAWEALASTLGPQLRVIAHDRRGWGGSEASEGYARTTVAEQSEDAAELIERLEAAPALLCGAGFGAICALDLLLRRPELVTAAVLIEPPLLALVPRATERISEDLASLEQATRENGREGAVDLYLGGGLPGLGPGAGRLPADLIEGARERPASLFAELVAVPAWPIPFARLRSAKPPSVIVVGEESPSLLRDAASALGRRLASSEQIEVGAEGPPHLEAPEHFAELLIDLADR